tara:strand:- start:566 stop:1126 length:561 start_codon:yes stop_codon:yes gene_type:complete
VLTRKFEERCCLLLLKNNFYRQQQQTEEVNMVHTKTTYIEMRKPCKYGCTDIDEMPNTFGARVDTNGQATIWCVECGRHQYNAPKTELGEDQRHIKTRDNIKLSTRIRIFMRANGMCELCGAADVILHVSHILSVDDSLGTDITPEEVNHDDNLACLCEACNIGMGKLSFNPRLYLRLLRKRMMND